MTDVSGRDILLIELGEWKLELVKDQKVVFGTPVVFGNSCFEVLMMYPWEFDRKLKSVEAAVEGWLNTKVDDVGSVMIEEAIPDVFVNIRCEVIDRFRRGKVLNVERCVNVEDGVILGIADTVHKRLLPENKSDVTEIGLDVDHGIALAVIALGISPFSEILSKRFWEEPLFWSSCARDIW